MNIRIGDTYLSLHGENEIGIDEYLKLNKDVLLKKMLSKALRNIPIVKVHVNKNKMNVNSLKTSESAWNIKNVLFSELEKEIDSGKLRYSESQSLSRYSFYKDALSEIRSVAAGLSNFLVIEWVEFNVSEDRVINENSVLILE